MARTRRGVGGRRGTGIGRGVAQASAESRGPENPDRMQRMEEQLAAMAGMIRQLMQQQANVPAAPVPPAAPPAPESEGLPVLPAPVPPVVPAAPEAVATAGVAPGVAGGGNPVPEVGLAAQPVQPDAPEDPRVAYKAERMRIKGVLLEFNKFKPQEFTGREKDHWAVEQWLNHMEKLFRDLVTEEQDKVTLGVHCLGVSASMWWFHYKHENFAADAPKPTWSQFKAALYHRYLKETTREALERELETIRQGDRTLREYEEEFSKIADLVPRAVQDERRKVRLFTQGLRPEIRRQLSSHLIVDYDDCIERCLSIESDVVISRAERAAMDKGKGKKRPFPGSGEGSSGSNWRPPRPPRGQNQAASSRGSNQQQRSGPCIFCGADHRPYTCGLRHGKCYQCGQPGHISANCPQRSAPALPVLSVPPLAARPSASTQSVAASSRRPPPRQAEGSRQVSGGRVYALTQQEEPSGEGPSEV